MFRQQSYQTLSQKFLSNNRWHPPLPEFTDVPLRHPSIATLHRHFCVFNWWATSILFGRKTVPCYFPRTVSSHENASDINGVSPSMIPCQSLHFDVQLTTARHAQSLSLQRWKWSHHLKKTLNTSHNPIMSLTPIRWVKHAIQSPSVSAWNWLKFWTCDACQLIQSTNKHTRLHSIIRQFLRQLQKPSSPISLFVLPFFSWMFRLPFLCWLLPSV